MREASRTSGDWSNSNRDHITSTVRQAELPVVHETLRQGRPYTLVLRKTDALFTRAAAARSAAATDLARIIAAWG